MPTEHETLRAPDPGYVESMLRSYMETALWSSMDESADNGGDPMDRNYAPDDIAPVTVDKMRADCTAFVAAMDAAHLTTYPTASDAGYYHWLSRNGHGVSWHDWAYDHRASDSDRDTLLRLSHEQRETWLYVGDDGQIHQ